MVNKIRIATNAAPPPPARTRRLFAQVISFSLLARPAGTPNTGKLEEGLEAQTRRMLSNIDAILNAAGCSPADIVKVTLLLADIKDFKAVDQIYSAWLPGLGVTPLPARTAFAAASLPAGALVMLDVVAAYPSD